MHALWTLERLGSLDELTLKIGGHRSDPLTVLKARADILASRASLTPTERRMLPFGAFGDRGLVARAGFSAASAHPDASDLEDIVIRWLRVNRDDDLELDFTARIAIREIFKSGGYITAIAALAGSKLTRHIDALKDPKLLDADRAQTLLSEAAQLLAEVSLAVPTPDSADFLLRHLDHTNHAAPRAGEFLRHAILHLPATRLPEIVVLVDKTKDAPLPQRLSVADNLAKAYQQRGLPLPDAFTDWTQRAMIEALSSDDEAVLKRGVEAVRDVKLAAKLEPLAKVVRDAGRDGSLRIAALEAAANLPASRDVLAETLGDPRHMILRKRAAELLAQGGHVNAVLTALPNAPQELALSICGALAKTDAGGAALLDAIDAGKASPRLLLNKAVAGPLNSRPKTLQDRAAALTKDLPPEDARLNAVITERAANYAKAKPDAARGAQVFQQNCAACHRFRNAGGNVGPNLDGVIARGPARLIEDTLDPNRNVDPLFRQTSIETTDGEMLLGANLREQGEVIVFADPAGKDTTIPKAKIKKRTASGLSLMPPIFESAIPAADFNDLLGYLLGPSPAP